jgi:hypothetical protein
MPTKIRQLLVLLGLLAACFAAVAADTSIPKAVDRIFGMKKAQWERYAPRVPNSKWKARFVQTSTGTSVSAFDPVTGMGVSFQPIYLDDRSPPTKVIVGSFQPVGKLPAHAASSAKEVEREVQRLIGSRYSVSARYVKVPPSLEGFELTVTRAAGARK